MRLGTANWVHKEITALAPSTMRIKVVELTTFQSSRNHVVTTLLMGHAVPFTPDQLKQKPSCPAIVPLAPCAHQEVWHFIQCHLSEGA